MAINKKLIHFKTKQKFNEELAKGNILSTSIVFILDTTEIYTHGLLYDGSTFDPSDIEASILNILDNYATKTEMPTKISQLENDANYILDNGISDGVYAVNANGKLIDYNTADVTALGVALVAGEHKFMIAKSDATDGINYNLFWLDNTSDLSLINYSKVDDTNDDGYLPKSDGTFGGSTHLSDDFTIWTAGALSDFNGKDNTEVIAAASKRVEGMYGALNTFNTSDSHNDWYVPACGQLALMYLNMIEINAALTKIGGTALAAAYYWSSTEHSLSRAWCVHFSNGNVDYYNKVNKYRVRFIRDISVPKPLKERVSKLESKIKDLNTSSSASNVQAVDTTDEIEDVETNTYVKYVALTLTDELKALVRENIGALSASDLVTVDLSNYYTKEEINALLGDINTILESIINGESITPKIITFLVGITEYQAEEGMTWEEWVNSDYNLESFVVSYDNIRDIYGNRIILGSIPVLKNQVIIANENYVTEQGGQSGGS